MKCIYCYFLTPLHVKVDLIFSSDPCGSFQVQTNPRAHLSLSRLPERRVHQHHSLTPEEAEVLHSKYYFIIITFARL